MATYTNLDASVDAGDPITTTLMQGLKDNPVAIAEGAATAPEIKHLALQGHRDASVSAGNNVIYEDTINPSATLNGYKSSSVKIRKAGTYRLSGYCHTQGSNGADDDAQYSLYRKPSGSSNARITSSTMTPISGASTISNGLLVSDSNSLAIIQVDIALSVGDEVNAEIDDIGSRAVPSLMKFQICVSDNDAIYGVDVIPQRKTAF